MWRMWLIGTALFFLVAVGLARAEEASWPQQASGSAPAIQPVPSQSSGTGGYPVQPRGPEALQPLPEANPGIVGYRPIPESMLVPASVTPATAQPGQQAPGPVFTNLGGPSTTGPYTLGRDDVVYIAVQGQPDFTGTFLVGPNGSIQFPYIGDVAADGLTKDELALRLGEALQQYVRVPSVQVMIVGFNSKAVYIFGRVARPGKYAMRGDTVKIRDAVIAAGLVVRHAKLRRVHIVKSDPEDPSYRVVDLFNVIYKGKTQDDVELVNGDIVVVPTTVWGGINDFLSELISPASHAARAAAIAAL